MSMGEAQMAALEEWALTHGGLPDWSKKQLATLIGTPEVNVSEVSKRVPGSMKHHTAELVELLRSVAGEWEKTAEPAAENPSAPEPEATSTRVGEPPAAASRPPVAAEAGSSSPQAVPPSSGGNRADAGLIASHAHPQHLQEVLEEFTPMDFTGSPVEPMRLQVRARKEGTEISWRGDSPDDGYRVYRLVSSDASVPYSPDAAEVLAVTTGRSFLDPRPMVSAVRHYQLWVNCGEDLAAAQWEQPAEAAAAALVAPPQHIVLHSEAVREDSGRVRKQVIGRWTLLPGAERVQVYRVPIAEAGAAGAANSRYRILEDSPSSSGFVDNDAMVGSHLYQFVVEAGVDGVIQLSPVVTSIVEVLPSREVITDLGCIDSPTGGGVTFDLSWTAPRDGRTIIFRTQKPPMTGTMGQDHPIGVLSHLGLPEDAILPHPPVSEGSRTRIPDVSMPESWPRAYFTAVHVIGDQAMVGATKLRVQIRPVTDPTIHQRVTHQVITFGWPEAGDSDAATSQASGVNVYEAPPGTSASAALAGTPLVVISKASYDLEGGVVAPRPLRPEGSDVFLVPYAFAEQTPVQGPPVTVRYPGLWRISYDVKSSWKIGLKRREKLEISLVSDRVMAKPPRFRLVYRPDRLPMAPDDGATVAVYPDGADPSEATATFRPLSIQLEPNEERWITELDQPGFVRVFALLDPPYLASVAVLDPPMKSLRCMM